MLNIFHMKRTISYRALLMATSGALSLSSSMLAQAQEGESALTVEEVYVTGSRRLTGSPTDIPSPVDIIPSDDLHSQGGVDLQDSLKTLVPSFNSQAHPLSGTASLIRPPNMRGLAADHTLVLVNGKRRHRAANIPNFSGGINDGTQGVDISNIPAIALKSVEVLRDGASAQYGADAIAGVMNFVANDDPEARRLVVRTGEYYEGDGSMYNVQGTLGFEVANEGSLNLSIEYSESDPTLRVTDVPSREAFRDAGFPNVPDPAFRWGNTQVKDNLSVFMNLVAPISGDAEFYGFGNYTSRKNVSPFFNRPPDRAGLFTADGDLLILDTTDDGSGNCPRVAFPDLNDQVAVDATLQTISALRANPDCFSFLEDFPGGFLPTFIGKSEDYQVSTGLRGELAEEVGYDVSATIGRNEIGYDVQGNANPSWGPDSPNEFFVGGREQEERTINAQLIFPWEMGLSSPINVAVGYEWHWEKYAQLSGQYESWAVGNGDYVAAGAAIGVRGFSAFNPVTSFTGDRYNHALYVDLEGDITEYWTFGGAVRYEDFSDLGSDSNFKLSSLYNITEAFGLRATYSTGFHAPTPGQQNFSQSTTSLDADGNLVTQGLLPAVIASQLPSFAGLVKPLTPETSKNISLGLFYEIDSITVTLDMFQIDVEDRLAQADGPSVTDADRAALSGLGFLNADEFVSISFLTNDFDTRTKGLDLTVAVPLELTSNGVTEFKAVVNHSDTEISRLGPALAADPTRVFQLENNLPMTRGNISLNHNEANWRALARVNFYGPYDENYLGRITELDAQYTLDVEVGYQLTEGMELSLGVQNLFDSTPSECTCSASFGNTYPVTSPFGFNGGFYYGKLQYDF